jgi:hypothetical protein
MGVPVDISEPASPEAQIRPHLISSAEATAFLDYFCDGPARTDHAVLIDAPWGAGKTYFIKSYLESRDTAARKTTEFTGAPFLYASLFGVSGIEEVREQFFIQAHPALSSGPAKIVGTVFAGLLKKHAGVELKADDVKGNLRLEAKVLVFDDLERAAMPLVDALGMINSFVEHGDYKIIVIANQAEVQPETRVAYERQREKVIGRTLTIRADPAVVLDKLISEMRYPEAKTAAEANRDLIVRTFEASGLQNLRSLRAAIADFDRLIGALDPKLTTSAEAMRRLLSYVVATEIELRTGLTRRELDALMSIRIAYGALKPSETPEIQKAETLQAKYPDVEWRDPIIPAKTLADYLVTGVIDVDAANQAILMHPLIAEPTAVPAWRRLIAWQLRGADAYQDDRRDVLRALVDHEIVEPGEICHVVGIALWLETMGAPLLTDVDADMRRYIDDIEKAGTLKPNRYIFNDRGFSDSWGGYGFCLADDPRFGPIKAYLHDAVMRVFGPEMKTAAPALMDQLRQPGNEGEALYDGQLQEGHYGGIAILHHVAVKDFADLLIDNGRLNRPLFAALVRRYHNWATEKELLLERPWLDALRSELDARADALGAPFTAPLKNAWAKTFNEISGWLKFIENRGRPDSQDADD